MIIGFFFIRPVPLPPTDQAPTVERGMEGERQSLLSEQDRDQSSNYTATSSTPLSRRAALNRGLLPNVYGAKLLRSSDFWLVFTIMSLSTPYQLVNLTILTRRVFSVRDSLNVYVCSTHLVF